MTFIWDKKNASGQNVPSGVYFYRISTAKQKETGKFLILK